MLDLYLIVYKYRPSELKWFEPLNILALSFICL